MEKKLLAIASSCILMGMISTALAQEPIQGNYSPFKDKLTIHFDDFGMTPFYASYQDNNGVDIAGPAFGTTDEDALIIISSQNKLENGSPTMDFSYLSADGDYQDCMITFYDGPYLPALIYGKRGTQPGCTNLNFSAIQNTGQNRYQTTIQYIG